MRILLALTRAFHSFATTVHIKGLSASVRMDDRKVARAIRRTDDARVAADMAKLALADANQAESRALVANSAFRTAAQAEASSLRRGVWL